MRPAVAILALALVCTTEDRNKDGQPDIWQYKEGKKPVRTERDTNHDGRPDTVTHFLQGRSLVLKTYDQDFDGQVDKRVMNEWSNERRLPMGFYNNQVQYTTVPGYVPLWTETDTDGDGRVDTYKERGRAKPERDRIGRSINDEVKV